MASHELSLTSIDHRSTFVGRTRAMRVLLVTIPSGAKGPLLEGFDVVHWNFGDRIAFIKT